MKTLRVTLADIEGAAHASATAGTSVTVSVAYSGQVVLTSGTAIPGASKAKSLGSSGVVDFSVYASDDPAVQPEYRGFAVVVTATVRGPVGSPKTKLDDLRVAILIEKERRERVANAPAQIEALTRGAIACGVSEADVRAAVEQGLTPEQQAALEEA